MRLVIGSSPSFHMVSILSLTSSPTSLTDASETIDDALSDEMKSHVYAEVHCAVLSWIYLVQKYRHHRCFQKSLPSSSRPSHTWFRVFQRHARFQSWSPPIALYIYRTKHLQCYMKLMKPSAGCLSLSVTEYDWLDYVILRSTVFMFDRRPFFFANLSLTTIHPTAMSTHVGTLYSLLMQPAGRRVGLYTVIYRQTFSIHWISLQIRALAVYTGLTFDIPQDYDL